MVIEIVKGVKLLIVLVLCFNILKMWCNYFLKNIVKRESFVVFIKKSNLIWDCGFEFD